MDQTRSFPLFSFPLIHLSKQRKLLRKLKKFPVLDFGSNKTPFWIFLNPRRVPTPTFSILPIFFLFCDGASWFLTFSPPLSPVPLSILLICQFCSLSATWLTMALLLSCFVVMPGCANSQPLISLLRYEIFIAVAKLKNFIDLLRNSRNSATKSSCDSLFLCTLHYLISMNHFVLLCIPINCLTYYAVCFITLNAFLVENMILIWFFCANNKSQMPQRTILCVKLFAFKSDFMFFKIDNLYITTCESRNPSSSTMEILCVKFIMKKILV